MGLVLFRRRAVRRLKSVCSFLGCLYIACYSEHNGFSLFILPMGVRYRDFNGYVEAEFTPMAKGFGPVDRY